MAVKCYLSFSSACVFSIDSSIEDAELEYKLALCESSLIKLQQQYADSYAQLELARQELHQTNTGLVSTKNTLAGLEVKTFPGSPIEPSKATRCCVYRNHCIFGLQAEIWALSCNQRIWFHKGVLQGLK